MIGWILKHVFLGRAKVVSVEGQRVHLRYLNGEGEYIVARGALRDGTLVRSVIPVGTRCSSNAGECVVARRVSSGGEMDPFHYEVRYVDGSVSSASEADLLPLPDQETRDPVAQLCALDPHPFPLFAAREQLLRSHMRMLRDAGGFRALLSSRIDLHPHQAYVAGVVTRDHRRR